MNDQPRESSGRWFVVGLACAMAVGSFGYRILVVGHLKQTSAFFIGLPAVLAVVVALTARPKSATGVIFKATTLLLLLSGILLSEGFICIVMAAPLFYLVGFIIGRTIDMSRASKQRARSSRTYGLILLPLLGLSLEGTRPSLSFPRAEEILVERIVPLSAEAVELSLSSRPDFETPLPLFLRLRFPRPEADWGEGLEPGAYRAIRFTTSEEPPGILVLRVSRRSAGFVQFEAESDTSMIAQWLSWRSVDVAWEPVSARATRVRWTLRYERRLDPAWYFGPWERYAARLAAGYLIDAAATHLEGLHR